MILPTIALSRERYSILRYLKGGRGCCRRHHPTSQSRIISRHYFQNSAQKPNRDHEQDGTSRRNWYLILPAISDWRASSRNREHMPNGMFERCLPRGIGSLDPHRSIPKSNSNTNLTFFAATDNDDDDEEVVLIVDRHHFLPP